MMTQKCDECFKDCADADMWLVYEPVEEGGRIKLAFCCQTCLLEYFLGEQELEEQKEK